MSFLKKFFGARTKAFIEHPSGDFLPPINHHKSSPRPVRSSGDPGRGSNKPRLRSPCSQTSNQCRHQPQRNSKTIVNTKTTTAGGCPNLEKTPSSRRTRPRPKAPITLASVRGTEIAPQENRVRIVAPPVQRSQYAWQFVLPYKAHLGVKPASPDLRMLA